MEFDLIERWWTEREAKRAVARAADHLRAVRQDDARRQSEDRLHAGLYGGAVVVGFTPATYARLHLPDERLRWNVCRPVVDTATAKIASRNPVRPMFLTSSGDYTLSQRAKRLGRFTDGAMYEGKGRVAAMRGFRDGSMFGTGIVKVYPYRDRVAYDRVMPAHLTVDYAEAMGGHPRTLYETRYYSREALAALYPKHRAAIESTSARPADALAWWGTGWLRTTSEILEVNEGWHLPDERGEDGRHVIWVNDVPLRVESWTDEDFPFAVMYWHDPIQGFWGQGALHDIRDVQREINQTLQRAHEALRHAAIPRWHTEKGSGVEIRHLRGGHGAVADIVERNVGFAPPSIHPGMAMPKEVYDWLREQYIRAFELSGVSQLSAQSRKPSGIESGVALREYHDIETERFATIARAFEEFMMDLTRRTVACARRIYEKSGSYVVKAANKRVVEAIDWKDVAIEDDAYVLQVWPSSLLPQTPAGKLDFLNNARNAGVPIDNDAFVRMLGFPDTDAEFGLRYAGLDLIDDRIETMLEKGEYETPDAYMPLEQAIERARWAYRQALRDRAPEERLALVRRWVEDCETLIEGQVRGMAQMMPPGIAPLGATNGAGLTAGVPPVQTPVAA